MSKGKFICALDSLVDLAKESLPNQLLEEDAITVEFQKMSFSRNYMGMPVRDSLDYTFECTKNGEAESPSYLSVNLRRTLLGKWVTTSIHSYGRSLPRLKA